MYHRSVDCCGHCKSYLFTLLVCLLQSFTEKDHSPARTSKRLVCGGSDHISKVEGRWNDTGCHQPTDVSHICKQYSLVLVGDLQYVMNKILCFLVYAIPFIEVLAF